MYFREAFLVAAFAAVPALATASTVNVYFGQNENANLSDICADSSFEYITLGFVNVSPENGGASGYPGDNFANHCWAGYYTNNGVESKLLNDCPYLVPGIELCQQKYGKKVLLSVGGYTDTGSYSISSYHNGVEFAEFLWGAFGPYEESWADQPRPFDSEDTHVAVDGYDFDIEWTGAGDEGYKGMIDTLRGFIDESGRSDIITGAPQCPLGEINQMWYLLNNVQFDRLWIQFYNNEAYGCEVLNADGSLNAGFNYAEWEAFLANTPSANAKLYVGLPGSAAAATTGYVNASIASSILCECQQHDMFGGLMLWDQSFAAANIGDDGLTYSEALHEAMRCGCGECPTPSSSTSSVWSTSTSSSTSSTLPPVTTTSSSVVTPSSSASTSSSIIPPSPSSTSSSASIPASTGAGHSHSHSHSQSNTASQASQTTGVPTTSSAASVSSVTSSNSSSIQLSTRPHTQSWSNTTWTSSYPSSSTVSTGVSSSAGVSSSSETSSSVRLSTRPHSWSNTTWTSSVPSSTSDSSDVLSTSSADVSSSGSFSTGLSPTSSTGSSAGVSSTSSTGATNTSPISSSVGASPTSGPPSEYTSTIWSTTVYTVTSCAASVTDCPAHTHTSTFPVSTTVISTLTTSPVVVSTDSSSPSDVISTIWSTTVYTVTSCAPSVTDCPARTHTSSFPVSTTVNAASSTSPVGAVSGSSSSSEQWTTSTIFSTTIYTITSCAATVTDCPGRIGSVTTEVIAVTTTVCPVSEAGSMTSTGATSPVETGTTGSSGSGSGSGSSGSGSSSSGSSKGSGSGSSGSGSSPGAEKIGSGSEESTTTLVATHTEHRVNTVTVSLPTSSSGAAGSSPGAVNNAGSGSGSGSGPAYGSGYAFSNGTATKTYSLVKVAPTGSSAPGTGSGPSKSTSATSPIVTAGAGRSVAGVGLAVLLGVVALVL